MKLATQKDEHIRPLSLEEKIEEWIHMFLNVPTEEIMQNYLFALLKAIKKRKRLLYAAQKKAYGYYIGGNGKDISEIQTWMKTRFRKDITRTPITVALDYIRVKRIPEQKQSTGYFLRIAQSVKNTVRSDVNYHTAHPDAKRYKSQKALAPSIGQTTTDGALEAIQQKNTRIMAQIDAMQDEPLIIESQITPNMMDDLLARYRSDIENMNLTRLVNKLLDTLKGGMDAPSIVRGQGSAYESDEQQYLQQHRGALRALVHTSVYDHTYDVLKQVLKLAEAPNRLLKDSMTTFGPVLIATTLAHDIGKIPAIRKESLKQAVSHADLSAGYFSIVCKEYGIQENLTQDVRKMIRRHHGHGQESDQLLKIITDAEALARTEEICRKEPSLVQKDLKDWMDIERLGQIMLPSINMLDKKKQWQAITLRASVYCMWGFLMNTLAKLAIEKNVIDYRLLRRKRGDDTDTILAEAIKTLKAKNLLDSEIPDGRFSRKFFVETSNGSMNHASFHLIVLKPDVFNTDWKALEERKTNYLNLITNMHPVT